MTYLSRLLLAASLFLTACATQPTVDIKGLDREQERFLELAFSPTKLGLGREAQRSTLHIRPKYTLSVRGNEASVYTREVNEAVAFFSKYFNIRRVSNTDASANIVLFIEGATAGGPVDAFVRQWNQVDAAIFARSGWTYDRNRVGNIVGYKQNHVPLKLSDMKPGKYRREWCSTKYVYDDLAVQKQNTGGSGLASAGARRDFNTPDYAVAYVFTGATPAFVGNISPEGRVQLDDQRNMVPYCIFEEIAHALNFWADVYSPYGEVPFNAGKYIAWDPQKETERAYSARAYQEQFGTIKKVFDLYRIHGLTDGLSRAEVVKRFLNSEG